jgi:hypothetical protein
MGRPVPHLTSSTTPLLCVIMSMALFDHLSNLSYMPIVSTVSKTLRVYSNSSVKHPR